MDDIQTTATPFQDVLLVCRKCGSKLNGGFGRKGKKSLAGEIRQELRDTGRRHRLRVVETQCLSLCPRKAVTVIRGQVAGEMLAVPKGADVSAVVALLYPDDSARGSPRPSLP